MNKKEFLDILYDQLSGQMPEGNIAAHIQYYRNYIEEQQQAGRTEADILKELGDPRLIARSLLDTEAAGGSRSYSPYAETVSDENRSRSSGTVKHHSLKIDLSTWYGKLAVILIAAVVLILLFTVLSILVPIVLVVGIILYLIRKFKNDH